jgi:hypothetical protein
MHVHVDCSDYSNVNLRSDIFHNMLNTNTTSIVVEVNCQPAAATAMLVTLMTAHRRRDAQVIIYT